MKNIIFILTINCMISCQDNFTAKEIISKSVQYHDPSGAWHLLVQKWNIKISRDSQADRLLTISLDRMHKEFEYTWHDSMTVTHTWKNDTCFHTIVIDTINGDSSKYIFTCDRVNYLYNTYEYLTGLPMKWLEPTLLLSDSAYSVLFNNTFCWKIKGRYADSIGTDTWYLYISQKDFHLAGYQFYHDESKNDGEYIYLSDYKSINGILQPGVRKWHWNKDSLPFRTDSLFYNFNF